MCYLKNFYLCYFFSIIDTPGVFTLGVFITKPYYHSGGNSVRWS